MEQDTSYSDNEQNVNKFVESVNKYGGFYIARYEKDIISENSIENAVKDLEYSDHPGQTPAPFH